MTVALKGLGFKFMNCILTLKNAGQMLFLNCCFVALFFGWFLRYKLSGLKRHHDKQAALQKKLFFAPFLGMAFRLFIPMSIASYLNLSYPTYGSDGVSALYAKWGEYCADLYAVFVYFLVTIFFPCTMLYVALVPKEWLLRPDFKRKYGFLYDSIKTDNFMQRAYFAMFIFRRAVLVYSSLLMFSYPAIQV